MAQLDLMTSIPYLARSPVYEREKPYQMDHTVHRPDGIGFANHELERHPITVLDIRNRQKPSIERNGFCIVKANTTLSADQASNARTPAMSKYLDEIERLLYREFPEYSRIEVLDWGVCALESNEFCYTIMLIHSRFVNVRQIILQRLTMTQCSSSLPLYLIRISPPVVLSCI